MSKVLLTLNGWWIIFHVVWGENKENIRRVKIPPITSLLGNHCNNCITVNL